jgi:hypothetical protein
VDVVVCTTGGWHLLNELPVPPDFYQHYETGANPALLGFECHAVLREWLGAYDYYAFLEDDLVLHDPYFFVKLGWFTGGARDEKLLQPNRYEVSSDPLVHKVYVDGDLKPRTTARFQDVADEPEWESTVMGTRALFRRTLNPHSGCFFLNGRQMERWAGQPYFLDRDVSFVGPLESAATLGVMRAFKVYKPAPENAGFLEIEHADRRFLHLLRPPRE